MMNKIAIHSDLEDSALRRLAYFDPNCEDEYGNQVLDYLVLDVLAGYTNELFCGPSEVRNGIKSAFKLDYENAEINKSAKRLANKGLVQLKEAKRKFEDPTFCILKTAEEVLNKNTKTFSDLEARVFQKLEKSLLEKYENDLVLKENISRVIEAFKSFLTRMIIRHGRETVTVIYPNDPKTNNWIQSIKSGILREISEFDEDIKAYLSFEITGFLMSSDNDLRAYLNNLFNSSFSGT